MKLKTRFKILVSIIILIMLVSSIIVFADTGIDTSNLDNIKGKTSQTTYKYLFKNTNVFCVERGVLFGTTNKIDDNKNNTYSFNISNVYTVTDDKLIYILNLPDDNYPTDEDRINKHSLGVKQNLIWWYLKDHFQDKIFLDSSGNAKSAKDLGINVTTGAKWEDDNFIENSGGMRPLKNNLEDFSGCTCKLYNGVHTYLCEYNLMKEKVKNYNVIEESIAIKNNKITIDSTKQTANFTITGNYEEYKIYINDSTTALQTSQYTVSTSSNGEKNISISLDKFSGGSAKVTVKGYQTKSFAKVCIISNEKNYQKLICTSGGTQKVEIGTHTVTKDFQTNVSLQKYITQVNGVDINQSQTGLTTRINKKTSESDTDVAERISKNNTSANAEYKKSSPVNIKVGDTVTYYIRVYNNSNIEAKNIIIKDRLPNKNNIAKSTIVSATTVNDANVNTVDNGNGTYNFTIASLSANRETYIKVVLRFDEYVEGILANTAWIASTTPNNKTSYRTADRDYVEMKKPNVSLQKYIIGVNVNEDTNTDNYNSLNDTNTSLVDRKNRRTKSGQENVNGILDEISLNNTVDNVSEYKYDKPVNIEVGDKVTYRIWIYNNSTTKADKVIVRENLPYYTTNNNAIRSYVNIVSIKNNNNEAISYSKFEGNLTDNPNTYEWIVNDLSGMSQIYFDVTLEFTKNTSEILTNTAWVTGVEPSNEKNSYRTVDRDYVKMCDYSVSLEKYVSAVNGGGVGDNRSNKPIYSLTMGKYKFNSPVEVEIGDVVTYTLKLKNTSNKPIKVSQIYDLFESKLTYIDYNTEYGTSLEINNQTSGELYININEPTLIQPGESAIIKLDFKVEVPYQNTNEEHIIENNATVQQIKNGNDCIVSDSDGNTNNTDSDWIKTKTYSVSLEKFITKVTDKNGGNVVEYSDRDGKRYNETATTTENKNTYKLNNKVEVEVGDIVTYTIRLKNTHGSTSVKINKIEDVFHFEDNIKLVIHNGGQAIIGSNGSKYDVYYEEDNVYIIEAINAILLEPGECEYLSISFKVEVATNLTDEVQELKNKAGIINTTIKNRNNVFVIDNDGEDNNYDEDWVKTKTYKISLEKYVSHINGEAITDNRSGKAEYLTKNGDKYDDNTDSDTELARHNTYKYDNVVVVGNGDYVTYTIKVTNNGDTKVRIEHIKDLLPNLGVSEYKIGGYTTEGYTKLDASNREITINRAGANLLENGQSVTVFVTVKINEPNISLNTIKNTAKVEGFVNRNDVNVLDLTPYNNEDSDYINLKDIKISGVVWNDRAFDKNASDYNGLFDTDKEAGISGVKVELYEGTSTTPVATTITGNNGEYSFEGTNNLLIKASKVEGTNRWNSYKSYYIKYKYDGITYTSTVVGEGEGLGIFNNIYNDSNAEETLEDRKEFNNKFSTINNESEIEYTTKNEKGFIPQSNHIYNSETMTIQASTSSISIGNENITEEKLQHINLGLRGRDTFDLELTSDIYSANVTVNGVQGVYNYNNSAITIRHEDIQNVVEDSANIANHTVETNISEENQNVRDTDISKDPKLEIKVTYKLTVKNVSKTSGTATKVMDYYDDKYTFIKAYSQDNTVLKGTEGETGNGFKSIIIETKQNMLTTDSNTMEIYVEFELGNTAENIYANNFLKDLEVGEKIATYNIAEIYEYTTTIGKNQTEFTRGLIDVDTAPGSANVEQVRLKSTEGQDTSTTGGNPTTVGYYFNKKLDANTNNSEYLEDLKYEDDTYTAPILYFVVNDNKRVIEGVVFEDKTYIDNGTKIKTGNGKLDEGEVGVYGATVQLFEVKGDTLNEVQKVTTDTKGQFKFEGFVPGKYIIRYSYGDTTNTVLLHQSDDKTVNTQTYNGEDYQATNNSYDITVKDKDGKVLLKSNLLNRTENFWYSYNELDGISVATDNILRRKNVSDNVTEFTDDQMTVLNNLRDGKNLEESKVNDITVDNIIENTYMFAETETMIMTVEKTEIKENEQNKIELVQRTSFSEYVVSNMNFGISEVPVTRIDLKKEIQAFTVKDAAGKNTIASLSRDESGKWKLEETVGSVIPLENDLSVSIENEKLQGAKLEVTFNVKADMEIEKNFDNSEAEVPTIVGVVDFISNNLSYNESLGDNSKYWELTDNSYLTSKFGEGNYGTVENSNGSLYNVKVKATIDNPLSRATEGSASVPIVLEKVLTSTDSTIEEIITSTVDTFEYSNIVEIVDISYNNSPRDRIRTPEGYIIIPGKQYDSVQSTETLVIHPPTGTTDVDIAYYIIALISLIVLSGGIIAIKKYVIKK